MVRENLPDGTLRLDSPECTFLIRRLRPAAVLTTIWGRDTGALGDAPLLEIQREHERFRCPVTWFVDASRAVNAVGEVSSAWVQWLDRNRRLLNRVVVLVGNKPLNLTISVARHISRTDNLMTILDQSGAFIDQAREFDPAFDSLTPDSRRIEAPADIRLVKRTSHENELIGEMGSFRFRRLDRTATHIGIIGRDTGEFGSLVLDELQDCLSRGVPHAYFIDARESAGAERRVSDEWTAWMLANRSSIKAMHVLTGSAFVHFQLSVASHVSGAAGLMKVHAAPEVFLRAMEEYTGGGARR